MVNDFELFAKVATFVNSEDYVRIYHSHDLKRNLQKRVVATPIVKVLSDTFDKVTWKIIKHMNYMIKVSDEELTILRKFEISKVLHDTESALKLKFSSEIADNPQHWDSIQIYLDKDLQELEVE